MEPQPEEVMEPEADFSMPDTPEEELPKGKVLCSKIETICSAPENEIPDEPKVAEPQKEPETKAEEAAPMDFSDPHKLMTPEEIAALIAKM